MTKRLLDERLFFAANNKPTGNLPAQNAAHRPAAAWAATPVRGICRRRRARCQATLPHTTPCRTPATDAAQHEFAVRSQPNECYLKRQKSANRRRSNRRRFRAAAVLGRARFE